MGPARQAHATETPTTRRITRGMTTDAARRAVFETAELLENVMMQLPPRKIFVIQRVCKQFRDVVATSVKLQQRLFLRADGFEAPEWRVAAKDHPDFSNSDWRRTCRFVKSTDILETDEHVGAWCKPVRLCPTMECEELRSEVGISRAYFEAGQRVTFRSGLDLFGECSLTKTYLTQPPTQRAILELDFHMSSDSLRRYTGNVDVSTVDGLKVADLLHAIRFSESWTIYETATPEERFSTVSLQDFTGDDNFFNKIKVAVESVALLLRDCIVPTEEEWAAMAE
ncbi:hypothetical protein D0864_11647 [Hortaea werneckii]|uniref:F-box domain-containing protein n=1 Tax=Hortaea werneckii TaxID=91943 RepID=A0A3M7DSR8_HORWE|nr:hypothetical protein D0864_11647 [Hortaea werneckii]